MKKFSSVFFSGIFGILFFLILVGVLNIVAGFVANYVYLSIVSFLNNNLWLILLISIILLMANVFEVLIFPFNIFYPIFNAVGAVLWVIFIFRTLVFIDLLVDGNFAYIFAPFYLIALILVPVIVIIVGYVKIIYWLIPKKKKKTKKKERRLEWGDVLDEIKLALYNIGRTLEERFEPKKKRTRKKKKKK